MVRNSQGLLRLEIQLRSPKKETWQAAVTIRSYRAVTHRDACPGTNCQVNASRLLVVPGRHSAQSLYELSAQLREITPSIEGPAFLA